MADLEAVLADVSYLMAMEKSKSTPAARASKKIILPDPSIRSVMQKHLEKNAEVTFDKIFNQRLGFLVFRDFCENVCEEAVPQVAFYEEIKKFENMELDEERTKAGKQIYDQFIMKELLSQEHSYSKEAIDMAHEALTSAQKSKKLAPTIFEPYITEIKDFLQTQLFDKFLESDKYTRFCQWKNLELNIQLSMNDFSVHRIIGRGGFGEVYGCRKADTGKMYAMKCLDKKRIKLKNGESLALNERNMLASVSTGEGCPFIVCMTYAFQTSEKLCFILDLMNGGDLHYHLSQHGVFSEAEVRFYCSEIILGLEHMHHRFVVYRDLKPANILLDENGHVRISDLGLACDFGKKKPHASVGTHGYMAPEVLGKGMAYDSSADWFSFGCMIYKLLRGHSPFRQHKTKDRSDMDSLTLNLDLELGDVMSEEMKALLEDLLRKDVAERLGCRGDGATELKDHAFFLGIDWQQVYLQKYPPPLIPPRGEVNAADAFDIGSFDEEDTKGVKLLEGDQEIYKHFNLVISDRWQQEVADTVFEAINADADKVEQKRKLKPKTDYNDEDFGPTDCIVEGEMLKLGGPTVLPTWHRKHLKLYPNRLEFYAKNRDGHVIKGKGVELIPMTDIAEVSQDFQRINKTENCIILYMKNESKIIVTSPDKVLIRQWKDEMINGFRLSARILANMNQKVRNKYGAEFGRADVPTHSLDKASSDES